MARTVSPGRYIARRLHIIGAGFTRFAEDGYEGATTAAICTTAGIGSGTFFHYFPTKLSLMVGVIRFGTLTTRMWFDGQTDREDAYGVLTDYVEHAVDEMLDPRVGGFARAVGSVMTQPEIAATLAAAEAARREALTSWLSRAQKRGEIRSDHTPEHLAAWITLLLDGFLSRLSVDPHFAAESERDFLLHVLDRMLTPCGE